MADTRELRGEYEAPCGHCGGTGKVTIPAEADTAKMFFFGCWREAGHYWREPRTSGMYSHDIEKELPEVLRHGRIDGGFCPGMSRDVEERRRDKRTRNEVEGEARLTHVAGWTVLGWWDRSQDKRGASNSNVVAKGTFSFTAMLEIALARVPHVMERQKRTPVLVETIEEQ